MPAPAGGCEGSKAGTQTHLQPPRPFCRVPWSHFITWIRLMDDCCYSLCTFIGRFLDLFIGPDRGDGGEIGPQRCSTRCSTRLLLFVRVGGSCVRRSLLLPCLRGGSSGLPVIFQFHGNTGGLALVQTLEPRLDGVTHGVLAFARRKFVLYGYGSARD